MTEIKTGVINPIECFKEGWELIKNDYWILFAVSLVGGIIGGISFYILLGAMLCGIYYCFLQTIDGKPASFDGLWKGFSYILPSLLVTILIVIPMLILFGVIYVPVILAMIMGSHLSPDEFMGLMFGALAVDVVLAVVMTCFHTLLMFSFPLIVDRNLGAWEAITTSAKAVWRNLSGVAGLIGVGIVLSLFGIITCGLGMYFIMPIMLAGYAVAYRKIFPAQTNRNYNQPTPDYYQGI
jgi:uncharacterized membrane protein